MRYTIKKHFVTFLSPGTLFNEETTLPINSWSVTKAKQMAKGIKERHGATPFAFYFSTRVRTEHDLDSHVLEESSRYYLGGKVETIEDVRKRKDPNESTLLINMKCNGYKKIITNTNSWKIVQPLNPNDIVLDWP